MKRGQATTELALGSLVFVTVLLLGIHFAETGYAMLKVKEAAQYAMHRASGHRTHYFGHDQVKSGNTYADFAPATAGAAASARYRNGWRGVLTQATAVQVSCRADDTVQFQVQRPSGPMLAETASALAYLRSVYENRGGVSCQASANLSLFGAPSSFAEGGGGFFKEVHASYTNVPVCGAGAPSRGGRCAGRLATLTGDWGFEGPGSDAVNEDVPDSRAGVVRNPAYEHVVRELFDRAGGDSSDFRGETAAQRMMRIAGGMTGREDEWLNETRFTMSYVGERGAGVNIKRHDVFPEYNVSLAYPTVGADLTNSAVDWNERSGDVNGVPRCFMSVYGCSSARRNPKAP